MKTKERKDTVKAEEVAVEEAPVVEAATGAESELDAELEELIDNTTFSLEEEQEPEVYYLDDDFSAECPVPGFTGKIKWPAILNLKGYRHYQNIWANADPEEKQMALSIITIDKPDGSDYLETTVWHPLHYKFALAVADMTGIKCPPGCDLADPDTLPVGMCAWVALTAKEWYQLQNSFRVRSR